MELILLLLILSVIGCSIPLATTTTTTTQTYPPKIQKQEEEKYSSERDLILKLSNEKLMLLAIERATGFRMFDIYKEWRLLEVKTIGEFFKYYILRNHPFTDPILWKDDKDKEESLERTLQKNIKYQETIKNYDAFKEMKEYETTK